MYEITFLMQCVVDANVSWNRSIAYISFLSIKFVQAACVWWFVRPVQQAVPWSLSKLKTLPTLGNDGKRPKVSVRDEARL